MGTMAKAVVMPRSDVMTTESTFIVWLKDVGEPVEIGEPLFQVETEKSVLDIESLYEGVLLETFAEPGQVYGIGVPIGIIGSPGEKYDREALLGRKENSE
jgi:pyruvate dehydrogenase E2 component (dihydrolipoamide acetyltransferase)